MPHRLPAWSSKFRRVVGSALLYDPFPTFVSFRRTVPIYLADKGYDADRIRAELHSRGTRPVIPMRKSRKKRVGLDWPLYRLRNLVERCFNKLKNARRVATRYDKTAESFLGFVDITSIRLWTRHLSTRPKGEFGTQPHSTPRRARDT